MKILSLLFAVAFAALPVTAESASESAPIVFRSVVRLPDAELFSVSMHDENRSAWLSVGDRFGEYTITEFVAAENTLIIQNDNQEWRLPLAGAGGKHVTEKTLVISVSTVGFIEKPGVIQIRSKNPTALDVWKASGGGSSGAGNRLTITRISENGEPEVQQIEVALDSPGSTLDAKLKTIPLQDGDLLFFSGASE